MPPIGLDVHRDCCEVAVFEDGQVLRPPMVPARLAALTAPTQLNSSRRQRRPCLSTALQGVPRRAEWWPVGEVELGGRVA